MQIKSTHTDRLGRSLDIIYTEGDPLNDLEDKILQGVHAFCFYNDKMVLVLQTQKKLNNLKLFKKI